MSTRFIFMSYPIEPRTPVYGNEDEVSLQNTCSIAKGDTCNKVRFTMNSHVGTHIDFPLHFSAQGKSVIDYPADFFLFKKAIVIEVRDAKWGEIIAPEQLISQLNSVDPDCELLIIKTGVGRMRHQPEYSSVGLGLGCGVASQIREMLPATRAVMVDMISVACRAHRIIGRQVHREFLVEDPPILLIEDADLNEVETGDCLEVTALPLRLLPNGDGGPCTIIGKFLC